MGIMVKILYVHTCYIISYGAIYWSWMPSFSFCGYHMHHISDCIIKITSDRFKCDRAHYSCKNHEATEKCRSLWHGNFLNILTINIIAQTSPSCIGHLFMHSNYNLYLTYSITFLYELSEDFMQDCSISSALVMTILQSCTQPLKLYCP